MTPSFELPKPEEFVAPFKALNDLAMANAEKLVALQSKNFEKYSNVVLSNIKDASQISDLEGSKAFFEKQADLSKKVTEDFTADVQEIAEIGKEYAAEVQKLVTENVEKVAKSAEAPAAKKAPARSSKKVA